MAEIDRIRVDKWLWAVRLFKTRSIASEACKKGYVRIGGLGVKSSREIKVGDEIQIKRAPILYTYKVLMLSGKRMGAKLTPEYVVDITSQDQLDLLNSTKNYGFEKRDQGVGRPTKRERRDIEKLKGW